MGKVSAVLLAALVLAATGMLGTVARAGKSSVALTYTLYHPSSDTYVVEYAVQKRGGGSMDLAVSHECVLDGEIVQDRLNRLYWTGPGNKVGTWTTTVYEGSECTALVVDLSRSSSSGNSRDGYLPVSEPVTYIVR